ncbi:hypothetical protein NEMIN01_1979 [Nematocida minor]|uniref:uncharacterized protein n=1 Tax=Nematocida minor TaxID=1912983 RepID=UPI0022200406|nr:uncharacterized protein NEMIN01_1979 [Nematocida minor]KAI5192365.1 hypothetical protein NEMIN01_1979 [Nematocida minor]
MGSITAGLQKIIEKQKKKMELQEKRLEERHKKIATAMAMNEEALKVSKEEDDPKRGRRKAGAEKPFRGCTEEEAESDLMKIFSGVKSDKYMHILPDGRTMVVIKKQVITEGDIVRIEKGDLFEVGVVKHLHKGALILENKEREKKYPLSKLLSSRYVIITQSKQ